MVDGGMFESSNETTAKRPRAAAGHVLTDADAVEIWISRWLRHRPIDLTARFGCDSRRLYDIWWGKAFPGSRSRARKLFLERYPASEDRVVFGYRKIPRGGADPRQGSLFDQGR